ncbi:MAG: ferredoxin--NADP reductase [Nannocystis sp.]|nr:ferredoxin--NADP reductase [Nannocystis sp.]
MESASALLGRFVLDLRTVVGRWVGPQKPTFSARSPRAWRVPGPAQTAGLGGRELEIVGRSAAGAGAVTLTLRDPSGAKIRFTPGQFFSVLVEVDGAPLRRAYSAASSALVEDALELTIKEVDGGRVSGLLNRSARAGDRLRVLGPSGSFTVTPTPGARRRLLLIAGGSGITPMMSIIRTILAVEAETEIALIYGNRDEASILYREALAGLAAEFTGRLTVRLALEQPPEGWPGAVGRLVSEVLTPELIGLPWPVLSASGCYLCGPEPLLRAARAALVGLGIEEETIHEERFTRPEQRAEAPARASVATRLTLRRAGGETEVIAAAGATLLEAGLAAGLAMPFSCGLGGCGACKVRLVDGEVALEEPNCLSAEERAGGFVLACVAAPLRPCTIEVPA